MISFEDDDMPDIAAGLPIDDGPTMTTQLTPPTNDDGATRLLEHYRGKGLSQQAARELVDITPSSPAKAYDPNIPPEDLVATIITRPGNYDACLLGLAKAYESQRERIADLEEDVERLRPPETYAVQELFSYVGVDDRKIVFETDCEGGMDIELSGGTSDKCAGFRLSRGPSTQLAAILSEWSGVGAREAFVPTILVGTDSGELHVCIETECRGGLTITIDGDDGSYAVVIGPDATDDLARHLNPLAGVDGVEWKPVGMFCGPAGLVCLLTDGEHVRSGSIEFAGSFRWPFDTTPTHWAPLPKPPVVKS